MSRKTAIALSAIASIGSPTMALARGFGGRGFGGRGRGHGGGMLNRGD
jgi:hypothetical protein